jgi:glycosyltransferase involved in cell wall biosynthesis
MSTNASKVTVLMLTYNRASFLPAAIESVLRQSHKELELVIIDDGSTDDTPEVVARYIDPRVRYVRHEKNEGLAVRRKESLAHANGTYTAVLDSDDAWSDTEKLAQQVSFLETHPEHVLVGTFATLVDDKGAQTGTVMYAFEDGNIRKRLLVRNQFIHSSVMFRTSALRQVEGYRRGMAEDLDLYLQVGLVGKMANIPVAMTASRVHAGSANDYGLRMYKAIHDIQPQFRDQYPNYFVARVYSYLRLAYGRLKSMLPTAARK